MLKTKIPKSVLDYLYTEKKFSDKKIGEFLKYDKTYITHSRKIYGIEASEKTGRKGELIVIGELSKRFGESNVLDMNNNDGTSRFDIKLFNLKIEVKTANAYYKNGIESWTFQMANPANSKVKVDDTVWKLRTGRTLKKYHLFCDYIAFVFLKGNKYRIAYLDPKDDFVFGVQSMRATKEIMSEMCNKYDINHITYV